MSNKFENDAAKAKRKARPTSNVVSFPRNLSSVPQIHRMNERELCSVKAMIAYVAHNQNVREATVKAFLETAFDVPDSEQLRKDDYERVIAYLIDLRCELLLN